MVIGYKFIQKDMKSRKGNHKWRVGKWYKEDDIKLCEKGFHACKRPIDSLNYIYGSRFFIVEAKGIINGDYKFVAKEMRLIKEIKPIVLKRFSIWCAKRSLKNLEKENPKDKKVRQLIKATEDYLDRKISKKKLSKLMESFMSARHSYAKSAYWSAKSVYLSAYLSAYSSSRSAYWSAYLSAYSSSRYDYLSDRVYYNRVKEEEEQNRKLKQMIKEQ